MYLEAVRALDRKDGVESLHVAAYELREFMNALPRVLDVTVAPYEQVQNKIQTLAEQWRRRSSASNCLKNGKWTGSIDDPLEQLLTHLGEFVAWVDKQVPTRRTEAVWVLKQLLPTEHPMPAPLLNTRVDEWSELLRYFNNVAHHNTVADGPQLAARVNDLEVFLLEHLEPRTFDDQDAIDRLIAESEASSDS